eukprot:gb/GFBE01058328.1/.p1 GENE.gb/GFBE01058328.1/~~gb/GFBE01058328.1/.p1  ORF type:complete len:427 (+),score=82.11 gb/GFBE01058328.1/:1-1281(+)
MSSGSGYSSSDLNPAFSQSFSLPTQDEGDDGWPQQQRIYGDFYREPVEMVTRGVTLSGPIVDSPFQFGAGDFYREPDNVFRGLSLPGPPGPFEEQLFKDIASPFDPVPTGKPKATSFDRFEESVLPPPTPTDSFWSYEVTTFYLTTQAPFTIGNALLDFLGQEAASITKVNHKKYSIKVEVFMESVMCTLKIRTYSHSSEVPNTYAIEFQRRSGDCVTFNQVYQKAQSYMKSNFDSLSPSSQQETPLLLPAIALQHSSPTSSDAEISPLLDMAGLVEFPGLQAESATALAEMAKDPIAASTLCTESAFKEFQKLLQSDQTDVAYPTACLLKSLAQCPEAFVYFALDGFLQLMIDKVRSRTGTAQLVRRELAQALQSATSQSALHMDELDRDMVKRSLNDAIRDLVHDKETCDHLREAHRTLSLFVA